MTTIDAFLGLSAIALVVAIGLSVRELGIHRPKRNRPNAPAPRPAPPKEQVDELGELIVCGSWPINPGDRVRIMVAVPEYDLEAGEGIATCEAVFPADDVMYRFALAGRTGRDAMITFYESELWQLERIPT